MTTAPAGKCARRLTQSSARKRRASRLKPSSGAAAAAMAIMEKAAAPSLLEQGLRLKKLRAPSRCRQKKLSFWSRLQKLKKLSSTQAIARQTPAFVESSRRRSRSFSPHCLSQRKLKKAQQERVKEVFLTVRALGLVCVLAYVGRPAAPFRRNKRLPKVALILRPLGGRLCHLP